MAIFKKNEQKQKNKFITMGIALFILVILFLAGPAAAFTVNFSVDDDTPTIGDTITITAEIQKETTEVYDNNIQAKITLPDDTTAYVEMTCTPTITGLSGYGYGILGYSYGTTTEVRGYGYNLGYNYGYNSISETYLSCEGTYLTTVVGEHNVQLLNNGYVIGDENTSLFTVQAATQTPTGGSSSTTTVVTTTNTTTDDTTTDESGTTTETVYEVTETVTYTPEQLEEVLSNMTDDQGNALFTETEIAEMVANAEEYEFEITAKVEKITNAEGNESYKTTITTTVTNNTGKDQKNVKVVVEVPKEVSETASRITSGTIFTVLKDDPILEFTLPLLKAGQTQTVTYTVTDTEAPVLEGVNFTEPSVRFAEEVTTPTGTDDTTETNTTTEETPVEAPMNIIPIIIILVVLLVIVGVAYYKKDDIQKMLKK